MKCYYHPNEDSVAQCSVCYVFLCKYCYDNSKNGVCSTCAKEAELMNEAYRKISLERRKKECRTEYEQYIKNIKITGGIGLAVAFVAIFLLHNQLNEGPDIFLSILITIITPYLFIAAYSGYILLANWQLPKMPGDWFFTISLLFHFTKLAIAIIVGIFGTIPLYIRKREKYLEIVSQNH